MLPKMNDKFATFIEPARHSRGGLGLALVLLLLFYAIFMAKIFLFIVLFDVVLLGDGTKDATLSTLEARSWAKDFYLVKLQQYTCQLFVKS